MIETALKRAFKRMEEKNWNCIYVAVDLHGPVIQSSYNDEIVFVPECIDPLWALSKRADVKIIFYSSSYQPYLDTVAAILSEALPGFKVDYFNENPEVANTSYGDFSQKFYYDLMIEDKAGFEDSDWAILENFLNTGT